MVSDGVSGLCGCALWVSGVVGETPPADGVCRLDGKWAWYAPLEEPRLREHKVLVQQVGKIYSVLVDSSAEWYGGRRM